MSYCRWSDDDFQCDVYAYHDVNGSYVIHVACMRVTFDEPLPPPVVVIPRDPCDPDDLADVHAWYVRMSTVLQMVEFATRAPIGLPHDGDTLECATAGECADELERLRAVGYNVPQYAIDRLRAEEGEK